MKIKFDIEIDVPKLFIVAEGGDKSILTKYEFSEINKKGVYVRYREGSRPVNVTLETAAYVFYKAKHKIDETNIIHVEY